MHPNMKKCNKYTMVGNCTAVHVYADKCKKISHISDRFCLFEIEAGNSHPQDNMADQNLCKVWVLIGLSSCGLETHILIYPMKDY